MRKEKILIVEDDIDTQKFLKLLLKKYYELDICWSDNSFYELLTNNSYDLIIMDISIKGRKDGIQLISEIKNSQLYNHIPVICLSAHVLYQDMQHAYDAGVDIFLGKPVSNEILLSTIMDILNKHKV